MRWLARPWRVPHQTGPLCVGGQELIAAKEAIASLTGSKSVERCIRMVWQGPKFLFSFCATTWVEMRLFSVSSNVLSRFVVASGCSKRGRVLGLLPRGHLDEGPSRGMY